MAMSRKHYTEVAAIVKAQIDSVDFNATDGYEFAEQAATVATAREIANGLADFFKRDNSAFDRAKFLDACGLGD